MFPISNALRNKYINNWPGLHVLLVFWLTSCQYTRDNANEMIDVTSLAVSENAFNVIIYL